MATQHNARMFRKHVVTQGKEWASGRSTKKMESNNGRVVKASIFALSANLLSSSVYAIDETPKETTFTLTKQNIVSISSSRDKTRKDFDDTYGQFQVLIPKKMFPIPAPNCRKNIILRMPGTGPKAAQAKKTLDLKWDLLQSIHAVIDGKVAGLELAIDSGPYMKLDKQGNRVLEWCNAFIGPKTWTQLHHQGKDKIDSQNKSSKASTKSETHSVKPNDAMAATLTAVHEGSVQK